MRGSMAAPPSPSRDAVRSCRTDDALTPADPLLTILRCAGEAATVAAARELWEETGIDVRRQLGRLTALDVRGKQHVKGRYYFSLALNDGDSVVSTRGVY